MYSNHRLDKKKKTDVLHMYSNLSKLGKVMGMGTHCGLWVWVQVGVGVGTGGCGCGYRFWIPTPIPIPTWWVFRG